MRSLTNETSFIEFLKKNKRHCLQKGNTIMVRAKFIVQSKTENNGTPDNGFMIELIPVVSGSEENKTFYQYTPCGKITLGVINPAAAQQFEVGKEYYIDFTKAE